MKITPLIIGSGNSGQAIAKSLAVLAIASPELGIEKAQQIARGIPLKTLHAQFENPVLFVANPHGLHAKVLLEASAAGFKIIACEKPSCVTVEEANQLEAISNDAAIFHVYRQMWGVQTLKQMIDVGEFGEIISVEGRYWQSSAAARAVAAAQTNNNLSVSDKSSKFSPSGWKNDVALSGGSDVFLDISVHWVDAVCFLLGETPTKITGWKSFINSETSHRDTHVQLALSFSRGVRALTSVSKTFHGAGNHFEINIIGSRKSATWTFLNADEIILGQDRDRNIMTRKENVFGSLQSPHHGMGWVEGYIEISRQLISEKFYGKTGNYPRLSENLKMMRALFKTEWT